ncbi:MAG: cytochrome c [Planctomycetota bacterium]
MRPAIRQFVRASVCVAALLGVAAPLAGCRGERSEKPPRQFFPDMDDSPKFKPQTETEFFADGRAMRPPEDGTVAFGAFMLDESMLPEDADWAEPFLLEREEALAGDTALYVGLTEGGEFVQRMPVAVDQALLERGAERYNIYCAACHGYEGDGLGTVGRRWSAPVPSYHDEKYLDRSLDTGTDGYMFHIARNGLKHPDGRYRMPGYGHALTARDTWAIVAHIRVLQEALNNDIDDLPPEEARRLRELRGRADAGPADGAADPAEKGAAG